MEDTVEAVKGLLNSALILAEKAENSEFTNDVNDAIKPLLKKLKKQDSSGNSYYDSNYYDSSCFGENEVED